MKITGKEHYLRCVPQPSRKGEQMSEPQCPGPECSKCNGEYCSVHGPNPCNCDVIGRHAIENSTPPAIPEKYLSHHMNATCIRCGNPFAPTSNEQEYCVHCSHELLGNDLTNPQPEPPSERAIKELKALRAENERLKAKAENILQSNNFRYCVQFLKNGGERVRAIRLVIDAAGLSFMDAKNYVENLHTPLPVVEREKPKITCPSCRTDFDNDDERLIVGLCPVCAEMLPAELSAILQKGQ